MPLVEHETKLPADSRGPRVDLPQRERPPLVPATSDSPGVTARSAQVVFPRARTRARLLSPMSSLRDSDASPRDAGEGLLRPTQTARGTSRRGFLRGSAIGLSAARFGGLAATTAAGALWLPADALADDEVVLEEARSEYNKIQVTERGTVRTMYFIVDGRRFIESRWDRSHPSSLDLDYSRTMMAGFLIQPAPKRIMMMGLGGGILSNYLFERFPGIEIDAVDIDPEVVRLAQTWFNVPRDNPNYRVHVGDGRMFVERAQAPWDMQILDAFRGVFVPFHLKTKQFYSACLQKLTPDGVVVANLHNQTANYPHDRKTLAEVFPNRYAFVSEIGNQTTFVGSASPRRRGVFEMRNNARRVKDRFDFDVLGLAARVYFHRDWEPSSVVLEDDFKPADLERAVERHNETCVRNCEYRVR